MKSPLATAIAITVGLIILAGYFIVSPMLQNIRFILLDWAVILAGVAGIIGIFSLLRSHWRKIRSREFGSWIVILAFLVTLIFGLLLGADNPQFQYVVTGIQVPIEASLMAVVLFSLIFAAIRLFQKKKSLMGTVFLISMFVFLITSSSFLGLAQNVPGLGAVISAIQTLPVAGARGLLLGVSLGGIATGVRVLVGAERPYRG
jgi:hypothetical protein